MVDGLRGKRGELEASKKFTPLGLQEQLGDAALKESLPALKRARVEIEKLQSEIKEKRSKVTLPKPSDDQRKDHEEIRSAMRAMTPARCREPRQPGGGQRYRQCHSSPERGAP